MSVFGARQRWLDWTERRAGVGSREPSLIAIDPALLDAIDLARAADAEDHDPEYLRDHLGPRLTRALIDIGVAAWRTTRKDPTR